MYHAATKQLSIQTKRRLEFIKITKQVEDFVKESGIHTGSVLIQSHHTTCSVWVNEDEKNLIGHDHLECAEDLKRVLDRFAHPDENYGHNDIRDAQNPNGKRDTHLCEPDSCGVIPECRNGHAHAQGMILQHATQFAIHEGKIAKGRWQEILVVELDHDRERTVTLLAQGLRHSS